MSTNAFSQTLACPFTLFMVLFDNKGLTFNIIKLTIFLLQFMPFAFDI